MFPAYKKGDVLISLENYGGKGFGDQFLGLVVGKEYVVSRDSDTENGFVRVFGCYRHPEKDVGWWKKRFQLLEKKEKEEVAQFIIAQTFDVLRKAASAKKIVGYSRMSKQQLVDALNKNEAPAAPPVPQKNVVPENLIKKADRNATCSYAIEFTDGTANYYATDVCHARLTLYANGDQKGKTAKCVWLNIRHHVDNHSDKEAYKLWLNWMLKEGPFAQLLEAQDWKDAYDNCIRIDAKWGVNQVATAAVALREGSEFYGRCLLWKEICDKGFSPLAAWLYAQNFMKEEGKIKFKPQTAGHQSYSLLLFPLDKFKEFFVNGVWQVPGVPYGKGVFTRFVCHEALSGKNLYENIQGKSAQQYFTEIFSVKVAGFGGASFIRERDVFKGLEALELFLKK
jgi:hypothetical protein